MVHMSGPERMKMLTRLMFKSSSFPQPVGFVQVVIEFKSASVYDELPENEEKPPRGEGLNKSTTVTLLGVFPKGDNPSEEQKRKYEQKVRRNTEKIGDVALVFCFARVLCCHVCSSVCPNALESGKRSVFLLHVSSRSFS